MGKRLLESQGVSLGRITERIGPQSSSEIDDGPSNSKAESTGWQFYGEKCDECRSDPIDRWLFRGRVILYSLRRPEGNLVNSRNACGRRSFDLHPEIDRFSRAGGRRRLHDYSVSR